MDNTAWTVLAILVVIIAMLALLLLDTHNKLARLIMAVDEMAKAQNKNNFFFKNRLDQIAPVPQEIAPDEVKL